MKIRLNKTVWRTVSFTTASLLLVVSFQNCGKAGFDAELDSEVLDSSSDAALTAKYGSATAQKVMNVPFAFETSFDQITYNSCAATHLQSNSAFASLQAGAYYRGGISLSDDFYNYADSNFKPTYPATSLSTNQYKEYLADSPNNHNAVPNLAMRAKNDLTSVYANRANATAPVLNVDIVPMVSKLTDTLVMDSFAERDTVARYFPFSPELRTLEGALNYNANEDLARSFRETLMNSGILALTYMEPDAEIYKVRSASDSFPVRTAYGKGYTLSFSPFVASGAHPRNPSRIMNSVLETDLSSPNISATSWTCGRIFYVVRAADAAVHCPAHTYEEMQDPGVRTELAIARRHLRSDQWDLNVSRRCAVPKVASCYVEQAVAGAPIVEYDITKQCYRGDSTNGSSSAGYDGAVPNSQCLHFISICNR